MNMQPAEFTMDMHAIIFFSLDNKYFFGKFPLHKIFFPIPLDRIFFLMIHLHQKGITIYFNLLVEFFILFFTSKNSLIPQKLLSGKKSR